jgi:hypothetical protein
MEGKYCERGGEWVRGETFSGCEGSRQCSLVLLAKVDKKTVTRSEMEKMKQARETRGHLQCEDGSCSV